MSVNNDRKSNPSRREFLGYLRNAGLAYFGTRLFGEAVAMAKRREHTIAEQQEISQYLYDISQYRMQLGLSETPRSLRGVDRSIEEYGTISNRNIEVINIPEFNQSYAQRAAELITAILGNRTNHFVRSIWSDQGYEGMSFSPVQRSFNMPELIREQFPTLENITGLILHEAIGHGTDPVYYSNAVELPYKERLKIERGKWKALTQAFQVPGEFLRHPGDQMLNSVKFSLAKQMARLLVDNNFSVECLTTDTEVQRRFLDIVSQWSSHDSLSSLHFNRSFCTNVGDQFVEWLLSSPENFARLTPTLLTQYQDTLEGALTEIYAEMVRISLEIDQQAAPNNNLSLVQRNPMITQGIAEVLSTIRGQQVSLLQIRTSMRSIVMDSNSTSSQRHEEESRVLAEIEDGDQLPAIVPTDTPAESVQVERVQAQLESRERFDQLLQSFYSGEIQKPENGNYSFEEWEIIKNYSKLVSRMVSVFPELQTSPGLFDHSSLHIWEIEELAHAMNPDNIQNIVRAQVNLESISGFCDPGNLPNRMMILRRFMFRLPEFKSFAPGILSRSIDI